MIFGFVSSTKGCNVKFSMASPTFSTSKESSMCGLVGPLNQQHSPHSQHRNQFVSADTTQSESKPSLMTEFSTHSSPPSTNGDCKKSPATVSPHKMPHAELIEASKHPPPRVWTLSWEELDAWRQVLAQHKKQLVKKLTHIA